MGLTLISNKYAGKIQDIMILPSLEKQMGDPLTHGWEFALISELGKLMPSARIDRHYALYDASISARTIDAVDQAIGNPSDFGEVCYVRISKATDDIKFPHIEGYTEFLAKGPKDANRGNFPEKITRSENLKLILE